MSSRKVLSDKHESRDQTPRRFRCSPVPKTAELIELIFTRPKTVQSVRPLTTGFSTVKRSAKERPRTVAWTDESGYRKSCAFVRKRIQEIREARLCKVNENVEKPGNTLHQATWEQPSRRRVSFFKDSISHRIKVEPTDEARELMTEAEKLEREEKLKCRHVRMTKLLWWFRVLRAICALAQDMKNLSMAITENTAVSQVYVYNACGYQGQLAEEQALFFDKSQFSRRKTMLFPIWAQKLALLSPDQRSEEDVRRIRGMMLMMKSFREKYTDTMQYKMAKVAMYINCEKGRVILRQGHWGTNFYFIYSGSVFVQKEYKDPKTKELKTQTENIIRAGESFGEIAILGDGKRTASIICREPTEVFQIDKDTFLEICPEIFEAELDAKIKFAQRFEIFKEWDQENFRRLCFLSHAMYVPLGKIIEPDWSKTSYAYFVMQGRISLMRAFDIDRLSSSGAVSLCGMMDKPLYLPAPSGNKYGGIDPVRFASVGELQVGNHNDLRALLNDSDIHMDTLSMVSQGAKVLRVEFRLFRWLGPMNTIEEYLRKRYVPYSIPADVKLCQRYADETNWDLFKKKSLCQIPCARGRSDVAMIPATSKGSSGWSRWPGSGVYRATGTTFYSPAQHREQVAEFLIHVDPLVKNIPASTNRFRRDTIGLPLEIRRTSLFPRSKIQKKILRNFEENLVKNDRSLVVVPRRPVLDKQRRGNRVVE